MSAAGDALRTPPRERPILFSGPMVRAILDGRKTQTRRLIKVPDDIGEHPVTGKPWPLLPSYFNDGENEGEPMPCPYGQPGDRLWVRERQRVVTYNLGARQITVRYEADGTVSGVLPYPERLDGTPKVEACLAYGGYRESSRITLVVTDVCVERLQAITEEDARAEGCDDALAVKMKVPPGRDLFRQLWDDINGDRATWASNPWVWVVGFNLVRP